MAIKLGDAVLFIQGDDSKLSNTLRNAEAKTRQSASNMAKNMDSMLAGAVGGAVAGIASAGVGAVMSGISSAFNSVKSSAIDMNAQLETTTLQFTTLMGDSDAAKAHVKDLFDFAGKTPFESGPVIEASRMMRVFGGAALDTMANLTMVGDAAAATSAPIDELGTWVGRLYSSIQAGRPFGEAAQRLQELAVMSPQARDQMERLQASGASADQVWKVFTGDMTRFTGAMALQAGTWQGLTSSITDSVNILSSTALKPLFDLAKEAAGALAQLLQSKEAQAFAENVAGALTNVITGINTTVQNWINNLGAMDSSAFITAGRIAGYFYGLAEQAVTWGSAIVEALAEGVALALDVVSQALQTLGDMFSYWLQPGSPPKLLPNLDKWGQAAAQVWIQGWTDADWNDLGKVTDAVDALQRGMQDRLDLQRVAELDAILADPRASDAQKERARLEKDQISLLMQKRKLEGEQAGKQTDVAAATSPVLKGLKDITGELTKALDPIDKQLKGYQLQKDELNDLIQLKKDEAIINDANATAAEKEAARIDIAMINARRAQRAQEAAALGVDLTPLQNIPITLEDIAQKGGPAAASVSGGMASIQTAANNAQEQIKKLIDLNFGPLKDKLADLKLGFEEGKGSIESLLGIKGGGSALYQTLEDIKTSLRETRQEYENWQKGAGAGGGFKLPDIKLPAVQLPEIDWYQFGANLRRGIGAWLTQASADLGTWLAGLGPQIGQGFLRIDWGSVGQGLVDGLGNAMLPMHDVWAQGLQDLRNFFAGFFGIQKPTSTVMQGDGGALVQGLIDGIGNAGANLSKTVTTLLGPIETQIGTSWTNIQTNTGTTWELIKTAVTDRLNALSTWLFDPKKGWAAGFSQGLTNVWQSISDTANTWWDNIKQGIKDRLNGVIDLLNSLITKWNSVAESLHLPQLGLIGRLAGGTRNWQGGLAIVGEQGPELVSLPRGSRVYPAGETQRMVGSLAPALAGIGGPTIVIQQLNVREEQDVYKLAYEIAGILRRR